MKRTSVGGEVLAVDLFGDAEQVGVAIQTERCVGELERAEKDERGFRGRVLCGLELANLDFVSTAGGLGPAEGVSQCLCPEQPGALQARVERRASLSIDLGAGVRREA